MNIAPPLEHTNRFRHFSCPQCQGVLEQVREGSTDTVSYVCRMGHRYSPAELLVGKELSIEQLLWMSLAAMDELIVIIGELGALEEMKACASDCRQRTENASALRRALEEIVSRNEPVRLDRDVAVEAFPNTRVGRHEG